MDRLTKLKIKNFKSKIWKAAVLDFLLNKITKHVYSCLAEGNKFNILILVHNF